jgi:outer membrane protein assembly factor BamB
MFTIALGTRRTFVPTLAAGGGVQLEAFAVDSGASIFSATVGNSALSGDLGIGGDVGYLGQTNGHLYAFAVSTGAPLLDLGGGPVSAPIIVDGHVFVATSTRVFSLELETASSAPTADPNGHSRGPRLSADGRYVAFESYASNLVSGDTNQFADIFVYDRQTQRTKRVNLAPGAAQANERSFVTDLSEAGRFLNFESWATNLGALAESNASLFVVDGVTGSVEKVNVDTLGAHLTRSAGFPD